MVTAMTTSSDHITDAGVQTYGRIPTSSGTLSASSAPIAFYRTLLTYP